eukprot:Gb_39524 [translate_table: standard]
MEGSHQHPTHFALLQREEGQTSSSVEEMEGPLQDVQRQPNSQSSRSQVAPRWTLTEMLVLVREKWAIEYEIQRSPSAIHVNGASDKWNIISNRCTTSQVLRTAGQCRKKWESLWSDYKKIKDWEVHHRTEPYWNLSHQAKKQHKLPFYLERELFDAMDAHLGKTPNTCVEATFDSMDAGADCLFAAEDDSQDEIIEMQDPTPSGSGPESLDSTRQKKRRRSPADEDDMEHIIASALRENSQSIQVILREATQAHIRSSQLEREMYWRGVEMNRQLQLETSELDRELRRKQSQDLVEVLGGLVNAMNNLVDAMQNKKSQHLNTP